MGQKKITDIGTSFIRQRHGRIEQKGCSNKQNKTFHIPPLSKILLPVCLFLMRKKMPVNAKAPAMRKHDWGNEGCDIIAKGYKRVRLWEPREAGVARYDQRL